MLRFNLILLFSIVFTLIFNLSVQADDSSASFEGKIEILLVPGQKKLPGLTLDPSQFLEVSVQEKTPVVRIKARLRIAEDSTVISTDKRVRITPSTKEGDLEIIVAVVGEQNAFALTEVTPLGATYQVQYILVIPGGPAQAPEESSVVRRFQRYSVSLGGSSLQLNHRGIVNLSEIALTLKGSAIFPLSSPGWNVGSTLYFTLLPLSTNISGVSARYLGWNLRVGRAFPLTGGWTFSAFGGLYYSTTFSSGLDFGFVNLYGPQVFFSVRKDFGSSEFAFYAKFAPVADRIALLSLDSRELAVGAAWKKPFREANALSVNLDYSNSTLSISDVTVTASSLSLALGFHW